MATTTTTTSAAGIAISLVTTEVLKVTTTCVEAAINNMSIELAAGGTITIEGCTFNETGGLSGQGFPDQCSTASINAAINGGSLGLSVATVLNSAIQAKAGMAGNKNTLIEKIRDSLTDSAVAFCSALAVNNLALRISAAGNITIKNCSVTQDAHAMIGRCIHNVVVDGMPLSQFLKLNIDESGQYAGVTDPATGGLVLSAPSCPTSTLTMQALRPILIALYIIIGLVVLSLLLTPLYYWHKTQPYRT